MDFRQYTLVCRAFYNVPAEPRSVVTVHRKDPVLQSVAAVDCSIDRKISALRVPPDAHRTAALSKHLFHVRNGFQLPGRLREVSHVKILSPSRDCIVRAAERHIDTAIRQPGAHDRKLGLLLLTDVIDVTPELYIAEPLCFRHLLQNKRRRLCH